MPAPKDVALENAARVNEKVARQQYGMALPMLRQQQQRGLEGAMNSTAPYLDKGMKIAGTSSIDAAIRAAMEQEKGYQARSKGAVNAGNISAVLDPSVNLSLGRHTNSVNMALANLRHGQGMLDSALGLTVTGASGAASAAGEELRSINNMASVHPALVAALAATDAIYGVTRTLAKPKAGTGSPYENTGLTAQEAQDSWANESMGR